MPTQHTAIVLIHGIGDFSPGSAIKSVIGSLRLQFPDLGIGELQASYGDKTQRCSIRAGAALTSDVEIIEFFWSGDAGKIRSRNPVLAIKRLFEVLWYLPRLGLKPNDSSIKRVMATLVAGFLVLSALLTVAFVARFGNFDGSATVPLADRAWYDLFIGYGWAISLLGVFIVSLASLAVLMVSAGRWRSGWPTLFCGVLATALTLFMLSVLAPFFVGVLGSAFFTGYWWFSLLAAGIAIALWRWIATGVDLIRDVIQYFAPDRRGNENQVTVQTKLRLASILDTLAASNVHKIVLVAHSLGTVIVSEVLREHAQATRNSRPTLQLVTCGSPLDGLMPRLLPWRVPRMHTLFEEISENRRFAFADWLNAYRVADYVGRRLTIPRTADPNLSRQLINICLSPWYRPPYLHSNYWGDRRFLALVIEFVGLLRRDGHEDQD